MMMRMTRMMDDSPLLISAQPPTHPPTHNARYQTHVEQLQAQVHEFALGQLEMGRIEAELSRLREKMVLDSNEALLAALRRPAAVLASAPPGCHSLAAGCGKNGAAPAPRVAAATGDEQQSVVGIFF